MFWKEKQDNRKKVLLVEDDLAIIDIYKNILQNNGFSLETIIWGGKALERIKNFKKKEKPDVVLLDLILPDMNGIEILKELKKQEETKGLPVFVLTNYDNKELEKEARELQVDDFILKTNFTPNKLVEILKQRLA